MTGPCPDGRAETRSGARRETAGGDFTEFPDLDAAPHELRNLGGDLAYPAVQRDLAPALP